MVVLSTYHHRQEKAGIKLTTFRFRVVVFNITINNISVISWQSVFLVEETGVSGENHRPAA